eukprot:EC095755.1.p3 GENE.EC095755.1~~EC095755.1.p3  ORF type:complete len:110 (-),score=7.50 EC095755.1:294-623(-)
MYPSDLKYVAHYQSQNSAKQNLQGRMPQFILKRLFTLFGNRMLRRQFTNNKIKQACVFSSLKTYAASVIHYDQAKYERQTKNVTCGTLLVTQCSRQSHYQCRVARRHAS